MSATVQVSIGLRPCLRPVHGIGSVQKAPPPPGGTCRSIASGPRPGNRCPGRRLPTFGQQGKQLVLAAARCPETRPPANGAIAGDVGGEFARLTLFVGAETSSCGETQVRQSRLRLARQTPPQLGNCVTQNDQQVLQHLSTLLLCSAGRKSAELARALRETRVRSQAGR